MELKFTPFHLFHFTLFRTGPCPSRTGLYFCFIHMDCFFSANIFCKVLVKSFERIFHLYPNVPHS